MGTSAGPTTLRTPASLVGHKATVIPHDCQACAVDPATPTTRCRVSYRTAAQIHQVVRDLSTRRTWIPVLLLRFSACESTAWWFARCVLTRPDRGMGLALLCCGFDQVQSRRPAAELRLGAPMK